MGFLNILYDRVVRCDRKYDMMCVGQEVGSYLLGYGWPGHMTP